MQETLASKTRLGQLRSLHEARRKGLTVKESSDRTAASEIRVKASLASVSLNKSQIGLPHLEESLRLTLPYP